MVNEHNTIPDIQTTMFGFQIPAPLHAQHGQFHADPFAQNVRAFREDVRAVINRIRWHMDRWRNSTSPQAQVMRVMLTQRMIIVKEFYAVVDEFESGLVGMMTATPEFNNQIADLNSRRRSMSKLMIRYALAYDFAVYMKEAGMRDEESAIGLVSFGKSFSSRVTSTSFSAVSFLCRLLTIRSTVNFNCHLESPFI